MQLTQVIFKLTYQKPSCQSIFSKYKHTSHSELISNANRFCQHHLKVVDIGRGAFVREVLSFLCDVTQYRRVASWSTTVRARLPAIRVTGEA